MGHLFANREGKYGTRNEIHSPCCHFIVTVMIVQKQGEKATMASNFDGKAEENSLKAFNRTAKTINSQLATFFQPEGWTPPPLPPGGVIQKSPGGG